MRIIGIDPGSRVAGYGIVEFNGANFKYIASGVVRSSLEGDFLDRLPFIYKQFHEVFQQYRPEHLAIESLIHVKNVSSLAKLAQARGAMLAAVGNLSLETFEYSPNKVKATVSGFGHADKVMINRSIEVLLGEKIDFATHDESDALAIAITHGINSFGRGTKKNSTQLFSRKRSSLAASINPDKIRK